MPENRIKQRLYQMSKDGEVKVVSRGRYGLHNYEEAKVTEVMDSRNEGSEDCYLCDADHPHRERDGEA